MLLHPLPFTLSLWLPGLLLAHMAPLCTLEKGAFVRSRKRRSFLPASNFLLLFIQMAQWCPLNAVHNMLNLALYVSSSIAKINNSSLTSCIQGGYPSGCPCILPTFSLNLLAPWSQSHYCWACKSHNTILWLMHCNSADAL